jgi:hypothetical protein
MKILPLGPHLNHREVDLALLDALSGERLKHAQECRACRGLLAQERAVLKLFYWY